MPLKSFRLAWAKPACFVCTLMADLIYGDHKV